MSSFRLYTYQAVGAALGPSYVNGGVCSVQPNAQGVPPGILAYVAPGSSLTYNIEVTGDDPFAAGYTPGNGLWVPFPGMTGLTATVAGSLGVLVRALRLNVTAYVSGSVTLQFIQLVA